MRTNQNAAFVANIVLSVRSRPEDRNNLLVDATEIEQTLYAGNIGIFARSINLH